MMAATYIHNDTDGRQVEYRRHPYDPVILFLEARVLQSDGTPYDDRWYRVNDAGLLHLQTTGGTDIIDRLAGQGRD
jgi:hypothetical protein